MRFVRLVGMAPEHRQAWERLSARAVEPNPFFEPGFAAAAAETLGAADAGLLVAEGAEGEWIGCMAARPLRKLGLRLALSTWNHDYSFLGTPLVDRDRLDEYATELAAAAGGRGQFGRFLVLRELGEGVVLTAIRTAIEAAPKVGVAFERTVERATLERRPQGDYTAHLKSARRSELRRHRRQLQQVLGAELRFADHTGETVAVDEFLRLERASWKGATGTAMACDPGTEAFFRQMSGWFGERDRFRIRALEADNRTIAMICSVAAGDTIFGFKSCFDEELRRYSPGIQLQVDDFEAFHARREARMDSCGEPDNQTLNKLWPDRRRLTTMVVGRPGPAARLARAALERHYAGGGGRDAKAT